MSDRLYCTLNEVIDDLELLGVKNEAKAFSFIRAASQYIDKRGWFVPTTASRTFDGSGTVRLWIDPLLSVTSITVNGTALTASEYVLYPRTKHWENGPYTSIELATGGRWTTEHDSIVIAGRWGLYDATRTLPTTTVLDDDITASDPVTVLSDGRFSPGAILLVGTEQMLIESTQSLATTGAHVDVAIDNNTGVITVNDAGLFEVGETIRIDAEVMRITDLTTANDQLVVTRGWNGSAVTAHLVNAVVYAYRLFNVKRAANGTTAAAHSQGAAVTQVIPPDDVNYLCRQIAALMLKKAQGGYAGKVGNAELGETFYTNEFPNDPLKKIMTNYRIVTV
jgi:hypothetical protein